MLESDAPDGGGRISEAFLEVLPGLGCRLKHRDAEDSDGGELPAESRNGGRGDSTTRSEDPCRIEGFPSGIRALLFALSEALDIEPNVLAEETAETARRAFRVNRNGERWDFEQAPP